MEGKKLNALEMTSVLLLVVGGLNWGLVGAFDYNLVTALFGADSIVSTVIFVLVGLAALHVLVIGPKLRRG